MKTYTLKEIAAHKAMLNRYVEAISKNGDTVGFNIRDLAKTFKVSRTIIHQLVKALKDKY